MDERLKKIFAPSEKVQKMYEAIGEYVKEKRDLSSMKVSEITSRAGIGKGTAYEYFSSKEEIMVYATMWLCGRQMEQMVKEMESHQGFQKKFFCLLEWLETHKAYNDLLLKSIKGSFPDECEKMKGCLPQELSSQIRTHIGELINGLMEQGCQEGILSEQSVEKRLLVFWGALMQYGFGSANADHGMTMCMTKEELKIFTYTCMVKALN